MMTAEIRTLLLVIICAGVQVTQAAKQQTILTIEEKNKQADTAYIQWKLTAPHSKISPALRAALTDTSIAFLVNESQMPFSKMQSNAQLREKVTSVVRTFIKKFGSGKNKVNERELDGLVSQVIKPEYLFQEKKNPVTPHEKSYNQLLLNLQDEETPLGTTLEDWALRFLTSESIDVALSIIEKVKLEGRSFNQLEPYEQKAVLESVSTIVTKRFMNNLRQVRTKYRFDFPSQIEEALKDKIGEFLRMKFVD